MSLYPEPITDSKQVILRKSYETGTQIHIQNIYASILYNYEHMEIT